MALHVLKNIMDTNFGFTYHLCLEQPNKYDKIQFKEEIQIVSARKFAHLSTTSETSIFGDILFHILLAYLNFAKIVLLCI